MRNNSGPSTDPWGTPLMTSIHSEKLLLTKTLIFLCFRKFPIHANNFSSSLNPLIFSAIAGVELYQRLFGGPRKLYLCRSPHPVVLSMSQVSRVGSLIVSVDYPLTNLCWQLS